MSTGTLSKKGGWYCYLITPFDADGDVDHGVFERYVDTIIECGADGVTCIATTTEGAYLTETERFAAVETVCNATAGRVPVNVGVGALSTRQVLHFTDFPNLICGLGGMTGEGQTYGYGTYWPRYTKWIHLIEDGAGRLFPQFRQLYEDFPDRFLIGNDVAHTPGLQTYQARIARFRVLLSQLTPRNRTTPRLPKRTGYF